MIYKILKPWEGMSSTNEKRAALPLAGYQVQYVYAYLFRNWVCKRYVFTSKVCKIASTAMFTVDLKPKKLRIP